uniref:YncE family protein n=1 Tax=Marinobacterium profundum TaxID=1714300 RepID=UPI0008301D94|nr:hypothetical protein [Marinobacterium profundum]
MRKVLLLIEKSSNCLSYYDVESGKRLHTVDLPDFPHEFVLTADGSRVYIGHYGVINSGSTGDGGNEILALDVAAGKIADRFSCGEGMGRPHGIGLDGNGRLYALSETASTLLVWDNPAKGGAPDRSAPSGGVKSHLFAITRDGNTCYSMNLASNDVTRFNPQDTSIAPVSLNTGEKPEGRLLRADEKMLYVANRGSETLVAIDTVSFSVVASTSAPGDPVRIFHDSRRGRLMTINYGGKSVSVFDESSLERVGGIDLQAAPVAMSLDPEMKHAYLSVDDNMLHIVDLDTLAISQSIYTHEEPDVSAIVMLADDCNAIANGTPRS